VIPEIVGDKEYLYVGVPFVTVNVSSLVELIVFPTELLPVIPNAKLIVAYAVLESVINRPAVSESVTVSL
jgi:hypothetical protein